MKKRIFKSFLFAGFLFILLRINFAQADTSEIPAFLFRFKGVSNIRSNVEIKWAKGHVDLSSVFQRLDRVKKSQHDHFLFIEKTVLPAIQNEIESLCQKALSAKNCSKQARQQLREKWEGINKEMSKRILYPENYIKTNSKIYDRLTDRALKQIDKNCENQCSSSEIIYPLLFGTEKSFNKIHQAIKGQSPSCLKELLDSLAKELEGIFAPKKCSQSENKSHPICKAIFKNAQIIQNRLSLLLKDFYKPEILTEAGLCSSCETKGERLSDLIPAVLDQSQCLELKPGEKKRIFSGTGLNRSYLVKRESDGSYSIPLSLNFVVGKDYDGPVPKSQAPEHYFRETKKCLQQANKKMLGPQGEKLNIIINPAQSQSATELIRRQGILTRGFLNKMDSSTQGSTCAKNLGTKIFIRSKDFRSSSTNYEADIDCPTVTHEILHLLGLCDEYGEKISGYYVDSQTGKILSPDEKKSRDESGYKFQPFYPCRLIQFNSIMASQYEKWYNVFKGHGQSLLDPGHFKSILYGSCLEKNQNFNKCSQLAYQKYQENQNCQKEQEECERQNILGRDRTEEIKLLLERLQDIEKNKEIISENIFYLGSMTSDKRREDLAQSKKQLSNYEKEEARLNKWLKAVQAWPAPHKSPEELKNQDFALWDDYRKNSIQRIKHRIEFIQEQVDILQYNKAVFENSLSDSSPEKRLKKLTEAQKGLAYRQESLAYFMGRFKQTQSKGGIQKYCPSPSRLKQVEAKMKEIKEKWTKAKKLRDLLLQNKAVSQNKAKIDKNLEYYNKRIKFFEEMLNYYRGQKTENSACVSASS